MRVPTSARFFGSTSHCNTSIPQVLCCGTTRRSHQNDADINMLIYMSVYTVERSSSTSKQHFIGLSDRSNPRHATRAVEGREGGRGRGGAPLSKALDVHLININDINTIIETTLNSFSVFLQRQARSDGKETKALQRVDETCVIMMSHQDAARQHKVAA